MPHSIGFWRAQVHRQLDPRAWQGAGLSPVNKLLACLILASTICAIVETEPTVFSLYPTGFDALEILFGGLFLLEYAARFWSCVEDRGSVSPWQRRLHFVFSPAALLDLTVILCAFLPLLGLNASLLRVVRLVRIARLAKLGRMSTAMRRLNLALWLRRYELGLTLALAVGVLLLSATILYWLESDIQQDKFGSVPRALWWAVMTLTTIGYGDVYPVTPAGKVVASLLAIAGIGLIALPAGIMAGAMQEVMQPRVADGEE